MTESAELRRRHCHAPSQIKHDETLHERAGLEDALPHIILAELASLHRPRNHIGRHIRRRRPPHPEIFRILPRTLAFRKKHQFEQPWIVEGMVEKDIEYL